MEAAAAAWLGPGRLGLSPRCVMKRLRSWCRVMKGHEAREDLQASKVKGMGLSI